MQQFPKMLYKDGDTAQDYVIAENDKQADDFVKDGFYCAADDDEHAKPERKKPGPKPRNG